MLYGELANENCVLCLARESNFALAPTHQRNWVAQHEGKYSPETISLAKGVVIRQRSFEMRSLPPDVSLLNNTVMMIYAYGSGAGSRCCRLPFLRLSFVVRIVRKGSRTKNISLG
jgi:hypothetical protein